jgi:hypothetical protein
MTDDHEFRTGKHVKEVEVHWEGRGTPVGSGSALEGSGTALPRV